jgi:DNA-directed RNA polymerase subunit RPC12/RpoP
MSLLTNCLAAPPNGRTVSIFCLQCLTMELEEDIRAGAACPRCVTGNMHVAESKPVLETVGFSKVRYRCTRCSHEIVRVRDDRFY